jgi:dihydroorotase
LKTLIKNAFLVNEGNTTRADILIENERIVGIDHHIRTAADRRIDADGLHLLPGIIDDQVHFREPGLTTKATIATEARAAVAGGTTSFMEMPNVNPPTLTQTLLEEKYQIAARTSLANYSFFMGASNDNLEEVLRTDPRTVCGVKVFMGSSTGNMLVDNAEVLERLFRECKMLIATHCEDEASVKAQEAHYKNLYGDTIDWALHPIIRDEEACYLSSSMAVALAKKHNTRLHILHISTKKELDLFENTLPLSQKRITAEVCVHHLYFNSDDYARYGSQIKCNPAIKNAAQQAALLPALLDNRLDIIATDHAPHTWEEKQNGNYFKTPSGVPLVQHSLNMMLDFVHRGDISVEKVVEKMCHAPAECFRVAERGFLREGFYADLSLVNIEKQWKVTPENTYYKCAWSPFMHQTLRGSVEQVFVSGHLAYANGVFDDSKMGKRLYFER